MFFKEQLLFSRYFGYQDNDNGNRCIAIGELEIVLFLFLTTRVKY